WVQEVHTISGRVLRIDEVDEALEVPLLGEHLGDPLDDHRVLRLLGGHHDPRVRAQVHHLAGRDAAAEQQGLTGPGTPHRHGVRAPSGRTVQSQKLREARSRSTAQDHGSSPLPSSGPTMPYPGMYGRSATGSTEPDSKEPVGVLGSGSAAAPEADMALSPLWVCPRLL